jgi:thiamine-phosphate pyrophosphorylase
VTSRIPAKRPLYYLITEGDLDDDNFSTRRVELIDKIRIAVEKGIDLIQIREKRLSARNLVALACEARTLTKDSSSRLLVSDRVDIALAAELDGVHLTETSLPVSVVREIAGRDFVIGCSRHSLEGVQNAASDGADFAVYGPIFFTPGKNPVGIDSLREVCHAVPDLPILGIGGINANNLGDVLQAGAAGIAAIRFLNDAEALAQLRSNE